MYGGGRRSPVIMACAVCARPAWAAVAAFGAPAAQAFCIVACAHCATPGRGCRGGCAGPACAGAAGAGTVATAPAGWAIAIPIGALATGGPLGAGIASGGGGGTGESWPAGRCQACSWAWACPNWPGPMWAWPWNHSTSLACASGCGMVGGGGVAPSAGMHLPFIVRRVESVGCALHDACDGECGGAAAT